MRIRDKKNQTYDRFRYLLEFNIKKGDIKEQEEAPVDDEMGDDVFGELGGVLDGNKKPEEQGAEQPQEQQPIENKTDIDVDVTDNQGFEDTASDLLKIHASKIDNLTQYINDSVKILQVLNQKTDEITTSVDQMNSKVGELSQRVDKLTPPTPLESLNQMITNTTGAQSIEDYWNQYFAKHGRTDLVNGSLYYGNKQYNENEKGMTSGVYKTPNISDTQIKDIIKNT
jgi:uncharacterized protein YoxC